MVPVGLITATDHKVSAPLALSEAQRAIRRSLCTPAVAGCNELVKAGQVAHPVIVVHQSVQPSIAAPLGWVLSDASQADLLADLSEQKQKGRVDLVSIRKPEGLRLTARSSHRTRLVISLAGVCSV